MAASETEFVTVGVDREFISACDAGSEALHLQAEAITSVTTLYPKDRERISALREQARQLDEFVKAARLHLLRQ